MASHDVLLDAARGGDNEALEALVRLYHDRVYRYGVRMCRDRFDADDAVQEAFTKLVHRPDVAHGTSTLAWLMTVVRNACMRLLRPLVRERQRLGERLADAEAVEDNGLTPERALERWRLIRMVHEAIATLDGPYREVLVLRDLEGLTGSEACVALEITEEAMKSRLHRARAKVRAYLQEHYAEIPLGTEVH